MIVESSAGTVGVIVDEVEEVLTVDDEQLQGAPGDSTELIDAIAKTEDRLIILLETDSLFAGVELAGRPTTS